MNKFLIGSSLLCATLFASEDFSDVFGEGKASGNVKYYYIQTDKQNVLNQNAGDKESSANANSIGGQLSYQTGAFYGFDAKVTFMTTNGFLLNGAVDTSILGRDNGTRATANGANSALSADIAKASFSVLAESLLTYTYEDFDVNYGRQVIKTPLIHAKEVRMLPSAVQGTMAGYKNNDYGIKASVGYLTDFKQRTSSVFTNIVEHALGAKTGEIIGRQKADVMMGSLAWNEMGFKLEATEYVAQDFMHSFYGIAGYKNSLDNGFIYNIQAEGIIQRSIGNADKNLVDGTSNVTGGERISADSLSLKGDFEHHESKITLAYSLVRSKAGVHDGLVLPWDGTPLFTNMITSNDLFSSNYGKGLKTENIYIGGTQSYKFAYKQGYDFTGVEGFKTVLSYLYATNDDFYLGAQSDINIVLAYGRKNYSLALKGIFVTNNSAADETGKVSQIDALQQYRVIANYKF